MEEAAIARFIDDRPIDDEELPAAPVEDAVVDVDAVASNDGEDTAPVRRRRRVLLESDSDDGLPGAGPAAVRVEEDDDDVVEVFSIPARAPARAVPVEIPNAEMATLEPDVAPAAAPPRPRKRQAKRKRSVSDESDFERDREEPTKHRHKRIRRRQHSGLIPFHNSNAPPAHIPVRDPLAADGELVIARLTLRVPRGRGECDVLYLGDADFVTRSTRIVEFADDYDDRVLEGLSYLLQKDFCNVRLLPDDSVVTPPDLTSEGVRLVPVALLLTPTAFATPVAEATDLRERLPQKCLRVVLGWLRERASASGTPVKKPPAGAFPPTFSAADVYEAVRPTGKEPEVEALPAALLPTLRPYQKRAVAWMRRRESGAAPHNTDPEQEEDALFAPPMDAGSVTQDAPLDDSDLHPLWQRWETSDGHVFFWCPYTGHVSLHGFPSPPDVAGGILADEMGLGKTVEVLALLLSSRRPGFEDVPLDEFEDDDRIDCVCGFTENDPELNYVQCDECLAWSHVHCVGYPLLGRHHAKDTPFFCARCLPPRHQLLPTKATLIVTPPAILQQWSDEIAKHVAADTMSVLVYDGVRSAKSWTSPRKMAQYDVVLTTYDVLRGDLYHTTDVSEQRVLRSGKRYTVLETPLDRLQWWRVCLDEAQMVEATTAQAAKMALMIPAVHRWCVSGTPFSRGLDDLYGLAVFLGVSPYAERRWWLRVIQGPYEKGDGTFDHRQALERLQSLVRQLMWRSSKSDVDEELQLPPQTQQTVPLRFSAVESHFYRRQHQSCSSAATALLRSARRSQDAKVFASLLKLRQACCHPEVGAGRSLQANAMTMDELLEKMMSKAKVEAEEAQRDVVVTLNGLAAFAVIDGDNNAAVALYRSVLALAEANKDLFKMDKLPRLHALHHLADLLRQGHGEGHTLRDDDLKAQAEELRNYYLSESANKAAQWRLEYDKAHEVTCKGLEANCEWYADAVLMLEESGRLPDFIAHVKDILEERIGNRLNVVREVSTIGDQFNSSQGLLMVLARELDALYRARRELVQLCEDLNVEVAPSDVLEFSVCGKCHANQAGVACRFCKNEKFCITMERRLFVFRESAGELERKEKAAEAGDPRWAQAAVEINRNDSEVETVLRLLLRELKRVAKGSDVVAAGTDHLEAIAQMKREWKCVLEFWKAKKERVAAFHELEMSVMRVRVRYPDEEVPEAMAHIFIQPYDVAPQKLKLNTDRAVYESDLARAKAQLGFLDKLRQLRQVDLQKEMCPICHEAVGSNVVILLCGHLTCHSCVLALIERAQHGTIKCPTCRARANVDEISYLTEQAGEGAEGASDAEERIDVKGSFGTKIEAVVRQILRIIRRDPAAKTLIFSQWQDVLDIVSQALAQNAITFGHIKGRHNFQKCLRNFKSNAACSVLLLPIQSGANGLNLIEATNVIIVEPQLNSAAEAQAINRVHRIGQTKPTYVFRFIVKETIEERVLELGMRRAADVTQQHAKRNIHEVISLEDLNVLFSEETGAGNAATGPVITVDQLQEQGRWWTCKALRQKDGSLGSRNDAVRAIEHRYSWECLSEQPSRLMAEEPKVNVLGRELCVTVADRLLRMEVDSTEESDYVSIEVENARGEVGAVLASMQEARAASAAAATAGINPTELPPTPAVADMDV